MRNRRIGIPLKDGEPTFKPNSRGLSCNHCGARVKRRGVGAHLSLHAIKTERTVISVSTEINEEIDRILLVMKEDILP